MHVHHDSQKIKKAVDFIGPVVTRYWAHSLRFNMLLFPCLCNYAFCNVIGVSNLTISKDAFLSKVRSPIYAAVQAVMLSKQHRRSSMKADMHHCCYCVSKRMTRGIADSLHAQISRARLTACEVGVYFRKYAHPHLLGAT